MKEIHDRIAKKLNDFINKILFLEKKNIFKCEGLTLYPSEIHLILVMSEKPTNATQMAETLNVTKGAVSQTISRLEKKGVLLKSKDPYYKNELTLTFTPKGQRIFEQMKQITDNMDRKMKNDLKGFADSDLDAIEEFLSRLNWHFDKL